MSEIKALGLYRRAMSALKKEKYDKALKLLDQSLSFNPEDDNTLELKGLVLLKLRRLEECNQVHFKRHMVRLKKSGDIPSNINSIEDWMDDARILLKSGDNHRALGFLMVAAFLSPITDEERGFLMHHNNSKLYYEMAKLVFKYQKNYEEAMVFFEEALNLDSSLIIPEDIKNIYNEAIANHSGEGVKLNWALNTSQLIDFIPLKDKIYLSTKVEAVTNTGLSPTGGIKTVSEKIYSWFTHLLLTDYGVAFQGATWVCKQPVYHVPWEYVDLDFDNFIIPAKAAEIQFNISLEILGGPQLLLKSLGLDAIVSEKLEELRKRTVKNLKFLNSIPSRREYGKKFEYVHREMYKEAIKIVEQDRVC